MTDFDPQDMLASLTAMQRHTDITREACQRICQALEQHAAPAIPDVIVLTATEPIVHIEEGISANTIALYNPSPVTVLLGYSGGRARPDARPWSVPASSALVLPIRVQDVEIGADPADLAAGDAVCFTLRFPAAQPFFFGGV